MFGMERLRNSASTLVEDQSHFLDALRIGLLAADFGSQLDATPQLYTSVSRTINKALSHADIFAEFGHDEFHVLRGIRCSMFVVHEVSDTRHSLKCERTPMPRRTVSMCILALPHFSEAHGPAPVEQHASHMEFLQKLLTTIWEHFRSQLRRSTILEASPPHTAPPQTHAGRRKRCQR